jgi:hypothetical protein
MHEASYNVLYIIVQLKVSCSACRTTIDRDELRNDAHTISRPGITKSFLPLNKRNIL